MVDVKGKAAEETTSSTGDVLVEASWGTLEELLLVCAVNRHGTNNWDSVATELRKRRRFHHHLTMEEKDLSEYDCRRKYVDLRRRFNTAGAGDDEDEDELLRMVEELRKLRVQQLKREVLNHDVSIVSLQKKVKILEEEREKNNSSTSSSLLVKPETDGHEPKPEPPDLRIKPENANKTDEPENSPEKPHGGDSAEDRSVNESNSSKAENTAVEVDAKREPEFGGEDPVQRKASRPGESASESKLDDSINNNNKNNNIKSTKLEQAQQQQQSSDVQSSASLTKKKRRRFRVGGGIVNSSGDELEAEELSPANKRINVKSQPLIRFLDLLRSHKHGSVFHRRLPSQETEKYRNVVRQHMDLDMVQSKLDRGIYSECHPKFYRDLLVIFTNAVLFYRKSSAEHIASREMRKLVLDEINLRTHKPKIQPAKPDLELQHLEPVVKKPRSSTTMVVCRRRSSIQGLSDSMKKEESHNVNCSSNKNNNITDNKVRNGGEEKPKDDQHQKKVDGSSSSNINVFSSRKEKEGDTGDGIANSSKKLLTRERSSSLGRGTLRLSNNNSKKIVSKDGSKREKTGNNGDNNEGSSKGGEGDELIEKRKVNIDQKQEKASVTTVLKKQGVANFLKRIKQNSPSSQEKAKINDSDDEEEDDDEKHEVERKEKTDSIGRKTGGNARKNSDTSKEVDVVVTRRTSGRKGEKEAAASSRATGRPPKRKAAMTGGGMPDSGKRRKSGGGGEDENSRKKPRR